MRGTLSSACDHINAEFELNICKIKVKKLEQFLMNLKSIYCKNFKFSKLIFSGGAVYF